MHLLRCFTGQGLPRLRRDRDKLIAQIAGLPEVDGRKIPFELIDEYPIRSLGKLIEDTERHGIRLSQINLVCRVDDINAHAV